ncbi:multidrug ABC transporter ATP-binding protein [Ammoniphilus oxalaticus]|uniref:Multidrug ABC transporter ATP-binding protein n=1 Tax=Ammoniphilus oxalaticus TaxID=66863 RepID=A0A419SDF3_9BACL|nr:ABC transporter ATP-binding protein [Ammoniphilus oxalaticus]RKD21020.1 multidrug ABC transporter ATP-binding protein [Ammoniphilus oxalaticus]
MNSIKRYFIFVRPYWKSLVLTIMIGLLKFGIPLMMPLIIKYVIDDLLLTDLPIELKLEKLYWLMGGAFIVFIALRYPIEYYRQYFAQLASNQILYDIRDRLFAHLQKLSLRYYQNTKIGEVISRMINDVEQTKTFVVTGLMNIWLDLATLLIAIGIMLSMDAKLTLVAISVFPLYGISIKVFYKRLRHLTRTRSQALAELQGHLHERVQGMAVVKGFGLEAHEQAQFDKRNHQFLKKAVDHTVWNAKTFAITNTVTDLAPLLVIGYAGYQVVHGQLLIGELVAFYAYLERLYSPLRRLVNSSTSLTQSIASMDRMFELFDETYDIQDKQQAVELKTVKGDVSFDRVSFRYQEAGDEILHQICLEAQAGQTIALVGPSGGGKSSLVSLLPRFYDATAGTVSIDGHDIQDVTVKSLRRQIGMVLQDNILFSGSIKENILMGNPHAEMSEVIEAAKAANAHEFIIGLPNGYDTEIGERGVKLSGGQKQRVSIARVFLKNPRILILDEATSALDLESEQLIQQSLDRLAKDRTTFIVAHRLSTITHADHIVVIAAGRIEEEGTHQQLMKAKGLYHRLYTVQHLEG